MTKRKDILQGMNCDCTILKIQRLGKSLFANHLASTGRRKVKPLMISFSSNLELSLVLKMPKIYTLQVIKIFVSKWHTKDAKNVGNYTPR